MLRVELDLLPFLYLIGLNERPSGWTIILSSHPVSRYAVAPLSLFCRRYTDFCFSELASSIHILWPSSPIVSSDFQPSLPSLSLALSHRVPYMCQAVKHPLFIFSHTQSTSSKPVDNLILVWMFSKIPFYSITWPWGSSLMLYVIFCTEDTQLSD